MNEYGTLVDAPVPQFVRRLSTVCPPFCPQSAHCPPFVHSLSTVCLSSVHTLSIVCPQSVHRLSTVCPQSVHRLSTVCPQSVHRLSRVCPQFVHRLSTYPTPNGLESSPGFCIERPNLRRRTAYDTWPIITSPHHHTRILTSCVFSCWRRHWSQ